MPIFSKKIIFLKASLIFCLSTQFALASTPAARANQTNALEHKLGFKLNDKIPVSPSIIKKTLPNGLTYYIKQNKKPEQIVELRLVIKTGSIMEDDDQQGLAHFTEHMAFNGSRHFKKNELVSFLESIGIKFGADLNAYTSFDETVFILPVPSNKPENIDKAFLVLSDWAQGLNFETEEIDKERGVVLEEARLGKGAGDRINKITYPKLYHDSRYALRLPIGKEDIIQNFKPEAIKRFYKDWYRPDLMAVIVAGDIEPKKAEALIQHYFAGIPKAQHPRTRTRFGVPKEPLSEALVVTDKEISLDQVGITYARFETEPNGNYSAYRKRRIRGFFNTLLSQRLSERSQVAEPPFLGANSGVHSFIGNTSESSASASIGKLGLQAAIDTLTEENQRAAQFGFTQAEFDRAKLNNLQQMENSYKEREKIHSSDHAAELIRNFLTGETLPSLEREHIFHKQIVDSISLDEINQFAKTAFLSKKEPLIIFIGGENTDRKLPTKDDLMTMLGKAREKPVTAFTEKALPKELLEHKPTPGKIIAESSDKAMGTTELKLSNGLTVILRPSDYQDDQILFSATRFGGLALQSDADFFTAQYTPTLVGAMGYQNFTPLELGKMLTGKSIGINANLSGIEESVSGSSNKRDVETMFQTMLLVLHAPRKDPALFQAYISKRQEAVKNVMVQPGAIFQEQFIKATYPDHPRTPKIERPEDYDKIDIERVLEIYRNRFSSAKGWTFVIVGNFEVDKIKPLIETYLASLDTHEIPVEVVDHGLRPRTGLIRKDVFAGKEQKSVVTIQLHGETTYSESERLRFNAMNDILQLRLTAALREALGAVYSPRVTGNIARVPYQAYSEIFVLPCAPENVDKLIAHTLDIIAKLKEAGVTVEELNKFKENRRKNNREALKTNSTWLSHLSASALLHSDPRRFLHLDEELDQLTVEDVQKTAQRYLDTSNMIQVVMYPEKQAPTEK